MKAEFTVQLIVSVLSGIAAVIPVLYQLIKYVKKSINEKKWDDLVSLIMEYMIKAEGKFKTGAEKKEWVLAMLKATSDKIKVDVDLEKVSAMIDELCKMSKKVNVNGVK